MIDSTSLRALAGMMLLTLASGCSDLRNCPADVKEPRIIKTGISDPDLKSYWSAPPRADLDHFPAKTKLRFEHDLGFIPAVVNVYLSFEAHGTNGNDAGSISPSAGNQSLIDCWDAHVIEVRNDTCEDGFYIFVTATGEAPTALDSNGDDRSNDCSGGGSGGRGGDNDASPSAAGAGGAE